MALLNKDVLVFSYLSLVELFYVISFECCHQFLKQKLFFVFSFSKPFLSRETLVVEWVNNF